MRIWGIVPVVAALVGCAPVSPVDQPPVTIAVECRLGLNGESDRVCDPGVTDPAVTQENIHQTICDPAWLAHARPSTSYTSRVKREDMARYGLTDQANHYRLDHIIALGLGGHPKDPRNLYPQPVASSIDKDRLERSLHDDVCYGRVLLVDAQERLRLIWTI